MLIRYIRQRFNKSSRELLDQAGPIIDEYLEQGFDLTLRQLYYQFVARGLLENKDRNYKRLGSVLSKGRLAGEIRWDAIVDRTRRIQSPPSWDSPSEIVRACADQYRIDRWKNQEFRPEVWVEKEALAGVVERPCDRLRVPFFSCRGYVSQSAMFKAGQRLSKHFDEGQTPMILHFGDHDPSGIDMTRDICDRLELFCGREVEVRRLALNMDQVRELNPPPNPTKMKDARAKDYVRKFGSQSWELDALDPNTIADLITGEIESFRDEAAWFETGDQEEDGRQVLRDFAGAV